MLRKLIFNKNYLNIFLDQFVKCAAKESTSDKKKHETTRSDLPTFTSDEVNKHSTFSTGIWVSYGSGVYDITKFIPEHPGSDKIMLGAGSAIDPFWHIFQQHNTPEVLALLEQYRIGNLREEDKQGTADLGDPVSSLSNTHIKQLNSSTIFSGQMSRSATLF